MVILLRIPPRIKVYEALGALADDRVSMRLENSIVRAKVVSSDGSRQYRVVVLRKYDSLYHVYSNDNGTVYRRYVGYPIISVMMASGFLPYNESLAEALKGVPWRKLNEEFKKYKLVEEYILGRLDDDVRGRLLEFVDYVLGKIKRMKIYYDKELGRTHSLTDWLP
ncbi:MAG: hypothetical protein F7C36_03640 [Desulfurococcales archaeon]|nr:hypothetical protein [Desulfurococcales archaeon]